MVNPEMRVRFSSEYIMLVKYLATTYYMDLL